MPDYFFFLFFFGLGDVLFVLDFLGLPERFAEDERNPSLRLSLST
jgi:hypothetical protein